MSFIPYGRQTIGQEEIDAVVQTLQSDYLTTGPQVAAFEQAICDYTHARFAVAVANGTAALHLVSLALLSQGDKVLTTPNSFLATANSLLYAQAKPMFIDITPDGNIDLEACEQALQQDPSIKGLYAVHFSGNPVDQEKLAHLKARYGLLIVEDCAHALGAVWKGIRAGSCRHSDASILSFHPVKHLTTGEGGAITTNDEQLYHKLLALRTHGMVRRPDIAPWYYEMTMLGFNYRITDFQCAMGCAQFAKLPSFVLARQEKARFYDQAFQGTLIRPLYEANGHSSYHLYVVQIDFTSLKITKKELFEKCKEAGIGLQLHYIPINKQPYYQSLGYGHEKTPCMDRFYEQAVSLPLYPTLTLDEQNYVIATLMRLLG